MKIGLNATCFNERPSGAKQRFIGMYNELFKLMPDAQFIIFQPADCLAQFSIRWGSLWCSMREIELRSTRACGVFLPYTHDGI